MFEIALRSPRSDSPHRPGARGGCTNAYTHTHAPAMWRHVRAPGQPQWIRFDLSHLRKRRFPYSFRAFACMLSFLWRCKRSLCSVFIITYTKLVYTNGPQKNTAPTYHYPFFSLHIYLSNWSCRRPTAGKDIEQEIYSYLIRPSTKHLALPSSNFTTKRDHRGVGGNI